MPMDCGPNDSYSDGLLPVHASGQEPIPDGHPLTPREDWMKRYANRMVENAEVTVELSLELAEIGAQANLESNGDVWEDPEGAADEELSYWDNDE